MMTTVLSVSVTAALLCVGAARRRKSTGLTDAVLYLLAAATAAIAVTADRPIWKFGYVFLGVVIAGATTHGLVRRRTAAAAGRTSRD